MANDNKTSPSKPLEIPVSFLAFSQRDALELPGLGAQSTLPCAPLASVVDEAGKRVGSSKAYVAWFVPELRQYKIMCFPHPGGGPVLTRYVHETHVRIWGPLT